MNVDIRNYGDYRLTNHSGRRFDLYNRETGDVFSISEKDWGFIHQVGSLIGGCKEVEKIYLAARKSNGIDVA